MGLFVALWKKRGGEKGFEGVNSISLWTRLLHPTISFLLPALLLDINAPHLLHRHPQCREASLCLHHCCRILGLWQQNTRNNNSNNCSTPNLETPITIIVNDVLPLITIIINNVLPLIIWWPQHNSCNKQKNPKPNDNNRPKPDDLNVDVRIWKTEMEMKNLEFEV